MVIKIHSPQNPLHDSSTHEPSPAAASASCQLVEAHAQQPGMRKVISPFLLEHQAKPVQGKMMPKDCTYGLPHLPDGGETRGLNTFSKLYLSDTMQLLASSRDRAPRYQSVCTHSTHTCPAHQEAGFQVFCL